VNITIRPRLIITRQLITIIKRRRITIATNTKTPNITPLWPMSTASKLTNIPLRLMTIRTNDCQGVMDPIAL
jgi:hypothetical protein